MTTSQRIGNLIGVVVPFLGVIAAVVLLWNRAVDGIDLAILTGGYIVLGFGVTIGYHRLLTHGAFQTHRWVRYLFAALGSMSLQGSVMDWVADHRKHHAHTDEEGDPHSPHVGHGAGFAGAIRGLTFAHFGWLMSTQGTAEKRKYAKDLLEDPGMRWISRHFLPIIVAGLAAPAILGSALHGWTLAGLATGFLWGGLVRVFLLHHVTWSINSVCHFMGTRRFEVDDESRNVFWLALPSLGEAWHHNHHAFPRAAVHGLKRFELDPTGWLVRGMKRVGLAWDVVEIAPERQAQKLAGARAEMPRAA